MAEVSLTVGWVWADVRRPRYGARLAGGPRRLHRPGRGDRLLRGHAERLEAALTSLGVEHGILPFFATHLGSGEATADSREA